RGAHAGTGRRALRQSLLVGAARAGAPRAVRPWRGLDRELPQLRRSAHRAALLPLRTAGEGTRAVAVGPDEGRARRPARLGLARLADAQAARVQAGPAHAGLPARAPGQLHAALQDVPDPECRVLRARLARQRSWRRVRARLERERPQPADEDRR